MATNPTTPTPNNNTRVPRWAWYILGASSLLPFVLVLLFRGVTYVSSFGTGPFTNFGQPDLLHLNDEEMKARVEALRKIPFEERPILALIFECNPESREFKPDKKTGEISALATYQSKGARAFGKACVDKLVRARQTFVLAVMEATGEEWSDPVEIPSAFSYQYTTDPSEEKGGYKTLAIGTEGQTKEITSKKGAVPFPVDKIRFQSVGDRTVRVTVIFHPKGAGPR